MDGKRRTLWRIARQTAVCLLAGAVVTVAVAWVLALCLPSPSSNRSSVFEIPEWPGEVPADWERPSVHIYQQSAGLRCDRHIASTRVGTGSRMRMYDQTTLGWPAPSLVAEFVWESAPLSEFEVARSIWRSGIPAPSFVPARPVRVTYRLPVRPRWIPFLGDTLVFAAPIAMLWFGVPVLHRALRRRRGCRKCGYSLAGLPAGAVCPECGAATGAR